MDASACPQSLVAKSEMSRLEDKYWGTPVTITLFLFVVAVVITLLLALVSNPDRNDDYRMVFMGLMWGGYIVGMIVLWSSWRLICDRAYQNDRDAILQRNELDFCRSQQLGAALQRFLTTPVTAYQAAEPVEPVAWCPFRVEHVMSSTTRGIFAGGLSAAGYSFGDFRGQQEGRAVPNLLDASTILFLVNGNRTLRVLIPSPTGIRELVTQTLRHWFREVVDGTHLGVVLSEFALGDEVLLAPLSHPQLIDRVDAACHDPTEERPVIRVAGRVLQPGIVLASAVTIGCDQATFLPSGMFRELATCLQPYIGSVDQPQLTAAINQ